jgi:hypothetical protein
VIAAAHREGEVLESAEDGEFAALRVVLDTTARGRFAEWVVRR